MSEDIFKQIMENIANETNINFFRTKRKKTYLYESISNAQVQEYLDDGWEIERKFKTKVRVRKIKPFDMAFEDQVWTTFANLGFKHLNKDRNFKIPYDENYQLTQQIDVFAADDETILIVECKSTEGEPKKGNFKETIEAIGGKKEGLLNSLKKLFPSSKYKTKFIFATKNYYLSKPDIERLENYGIVHFNEETISYYNDLAKHLNVSARFQLLGNLFEGATIPELDNRIPAIQGKMGGHTYYSFSIEPEKLLKIGYVLHRNKANKKFMPTYQRLIKKTRLRSVQNFINEGGFFPNSIIINIVCDGKKISFDPASNRVPNAISKIGILHLPKTYRAAFIIDGQHRLYGYANSEYKTSNSIPVVAFVDLDRKDQVKLFMQINENQKAVPKNLRNTLNADLLWDSDNIVDQIKALKLQIAQDLGETLSSPLYDRVVVGENPKTAKRCITIDTIKIGLDRSNFWGVFKKNAIHKDGTFYKGSNDDTYKALFPFLTGCFAYIKDNLTDEWNLGDADDGFLTTNAGIESLIRIFSDIIDCIISKHNLHPKSHNTEVIIEETKFYLDPLILFLKNLSQEEKLELKKSYGTAGRGRYWRKLQKAISEYRDDFNPTGMDQYWNDQAKKFNIEAIKMVRDIETFLKKDFKQRLLSVFGNNWFKKGVPGQVQDAAVLLASQKNRKIENPEDEVDAWECMNIIDYRKIAIYGSNWRDIFEKPYTKPGQEKLSGGKENKTKWLQMLERIRNENFHTYSVKEEEYIFLCELNEWLVEGKVDNDLD